MPIKHAALKQIRKDRKRRPRNQAIQAELKTLSRRLLTLLKDQKIDEASTLIRVVVKRYDHAVSRNVIHRNTAARYKSRLTRLVERQAPISE